MKQNCLAKKPLRAWQNPLQGWNFQIFVAQPRGNLDCVQSSWPEDNRDVELLMIKKEHELEAQPDGVTYETVGRSPASLD